MAAVEARADEVLGRGAAVEHRLAQRAVVVAHDVDAVVAVEAARAVRRIWVIRAERVADLVEDRRRQGAEEVGVVLGRPDHGGEPAVVVDRVGRVVRGLALPHLALAEQAGVAAQVVGVDDDVARGGVAVADRRPDSAADRDEVGHAVNDVLVARLGQRNDADREAGVRAGVPRWKRTVRSPPDSSATACWSARYGGVDIGAQPVDARGRSAGRRRRPHSGPGRRPRRSRRWRAGRLSWGTTGAPRPRGRAGARGSSAAPGRGRCGR